jgi:hypothetical protein
MDESVITQNRRQRRSTVMLKATLETGGASIEVILRNLSQDGALVQGDDLPEEGTRVLFHRQGLSVPSRVAWSHRQFAGVAFDFPLFPREMLRHVPATPQRAEVPPVKRRPGLAAKPLSAAERSLIERWATECATHLGD